MTIETKFFYANSVEVAVSPFDISLKFMRNGTATLETVAVHTTPVDATPVVMDALTIAMSPSAAKSMLPALLQLISVYEQKFGTIPLPPEVLARWNAEVKIGP